MDRVGSPWRKKKNRGALLRGGTALAHKRSRLGLEGRDRRSNFIRIFFLFRLLRETSSELWVDSRGVWFVDTLSYEWSVIDAPLPSSPPPPPVNKWAPFEHRYSRENRASEELILSCVYRVDETTFQRRVEFYVDRVFFNVRAVSSFYRVENQLKKGEKGKERKKEVRKSR